MQLKELLTEDRAVSPVIGVILMVAITVILAAVIGTFVLGLGSSVQSTPQASFEWNFNNGSSNDYVNVTHVGGDELNSDNSNKIVVSYNNKIKTWTLPISAGDKKSVNGSGSYLSGGTARVIWYSPSNESSATLSSQQAPS